MVLIDVQQLRKKYQARTAVDGISFQIARGEVVGFLGPNGAGKTTTMRMLTGHVRPTSGTARIGGIDVQADSMATRRLLGYLSENTPLYDDMMVYDFLWFVASVRRVAKTDRRKHVLSVCE